jgi:hypothetical protein
MDLREATLHALYDIRGFGPYTGVMLIQIADRIAQGPAARELLTPFPQLGLLSHVLGDLVEEGLVTDRLEERIGFENEPYAPRIRTYDIALIRH